MIRIFYKLIFIVLLLTEQANGSCSRAAHRTSKSTDAEGNIVIHKYCQYLNATYEIGTTWTKDYPDCLECQCTPSKLICCGYGIMAGEMEPPEGCQFVDGKCDVEFVQTSDPSQPCLEF